MTQQVRKTLCSQFLVHIPKRVEDTIWVGGRELYFDGSYAEHFNKKLCAVVVGLPTHLGPEYLLQRRGQPAKNVPCSDIVDEVAEGDMLYVDWSVSEPHGEVAGLGAVYKASANQVVARVREGQLIPYGSYVFCRRVYPAGVEAVEVGGHTLQLRVSASGLALGSESIPALPYQGEVVHVGQPLRGQPQRVQVGDRVVFDKRVCGKAEGLPLEMKIEGQEYLCIRQDYIEAVLVPTAPKDYNYDLTTLGELCAEYNALLHVNWTVQTVVQAHQQGRRGLDTLMGGLIEKAIARGAIQSNFEIQSGI